MQVRIYIESTLRGPRKHTGTYEFVMEAYVEAGKDPVTLTKATHVHDCSENTSYVIAAAEAVNRLKTKCDVIFYTPCSYFNAAVNEYLPKWRANGFTTAKKAPVANAQEWQQISERVSSATATEEHHKYRNCLKDEVRRLDTQFTKKENESNEK